MRSQRLLILIESIRPTNPQLCDQINEDWLFLTKLILLWLQILIVLDRN